LIMLTLKIVWTSFWVIWAFSFDLPLVNTNLIVEEMVTKKSQMGV
jgi:hypothetical protein